MVRRGPEPCPLQRDRLARVAGDRDADEVFISDVTCRWIEVDPARTGNVGLNPGVGVTARSTIRVVIRQMQISGHEPSGNPARAKRFDHKHGEVATTAAAEIERHNRSLDSLFVPRHVPEGPPDGSRKVTEQLVSIGRTIFGKERGAPTINRGIGRQWLDEATETGRIFRRIDKRIGTGKFLYVGSAEGGRRVLDANSAGKAKLAGPVAKVGDRHVIA